MLQHFCVIIGDPQDVTKAALLWDYVKLYDKPRFVGVQPDQWHDNVYAEVTVKAKRLEGGAYLQTGAAYGRWHNKKQVFHTQHEDTYFTRFTSKVKLRNMDAPNGAVMALWMTGRHLARVDIRIYAETAGNQIRVIKQLQFKWARTKK